MLVRSHNSQIIVVLEKDQNVIEALTEVAISQKIRGGHITGIGAVKDVELGFYELHKKDYIRKKFTGDDYELIALNGNVSLRDGLPYIHVHTALGRSDFGVFGGHLFEARVAVTAEIYITPFGMMPERTFQPGLGLQTITHCLI